MGINGFKEHLGAFPEVLNCVKPLCKEIWGILSPLLEDGVLHTGMLYYPIIEAFDIAIVNMAAVQDPG